MKRKWQVFKDYYLVKTVIALVLVVAGLIYLHYDRQNRRDCVFQILMMDVYCSLEAEEEFEREVGEILDINAKKEYVDIDFCQSAEMLLAMLMNDDVDAFLMNGFYFEKLQEYLHPLDGILAENPGWRDVTVFRAMDEKAYGISIAEEPWMGQFDFGSVDDIIFCIADNSLYKQNACTFLRALFAEGTEGSYAENPGAVREDP